MYSEGSIRGSKSSLGFFRGTVWWSAFLSREINSEKIVFRVGIFFFLVIVFRGFRFEVLNVAYSECFYF